MKPKIQSKKIEASSNPDRTGLRVKIETQSDVALKIPAEYLDKLDYEHETK